MSDGVILMISCQLHSDGTIERSGWGYVQSDSDFWEVNSFPVQMVSTGTKKHSKLKIPPETQ
jgi:hypothetical protein